MPPDSDVLRLMVRLGIWIISSRRAVTPTRCLTLRGIGGQADGAEEYQPSSLTIYAVRLFRASLIDCERRGCNAYRATKSGEAAFTPRWRRSRFLFLAAKIWRHAGRVGVSYSDPL